MDSASAYRFEIGDKVEQSHSNHVEGTVVAVFTTRSGERRYAVETSGHRAIQIASADSLAAYGDGPK
jgi:hypothetical protein